MSLVGYSATIAGPTLTIRSKDTETSILLLPLVILCHVKHFSLFGPNTEWRDVQHEENVIYAQFGKDLFNISKVIGRKKVAQFFSVYIHVHC